MPGNLPDNTLLAWLQDKSNNPFTGTDKFVNMYTYFTPEANDPVELIKEDNFLSLFHCFQEERSR